jgi:uncharacterized protein
MRKRLAPLVLSLVATAPAQVAPQTVPTAVPQAVIADPPRDKDHPATMQVAAIMSHGSKMNGVLYIAAGKGPHPTLLFVHGFPGNEQNLDLAQAARRAGWNVLTMHYRGSWGSGGAFSFSNAIEDVGAALTWLRDPANDEPCRIDPVRIAVAGHSMGGFLAAHAGAHDPEIIGVALISAWNLGAAAATAKADGERGRTTFTQKMAQNMESLAGCTAQSLTEDAFQHADAWNFVDYAPLLAKRPLLLISSRDRNGPDSTALATGVRKAGGKEVVETRIETDHSYSDHRIALQAALVTWLEDLAGKGR